MADLSVIEFKIHIVKRILITWCVYFVVVFPLFSEQKVLEWKENNVVPMQSVEADLDDLIGMKEFFQDVRIVGIGETTHGTGDFIKLKD